MCNPLRYIVFNFFVEQYVKQYKQVRLICHTLELTLIKHESEHTHHDVVMDGAFSPSPRCAFSFPALLAFTVSRVSKKLEAPETDSCRLYWRLRANC